MGSVRPLALNKKPNGDILRASFGGIFRTYSRPNVAQWVSFANESPLPLVFCPKYYIFAEMNIFKTFTTVRSGSWKIFWEKGTPNMLKNIERLQIQAKSFENAWRSIFLLKLKALNLQLIQKITSTTIVFQLIFLPLKNNCLSKKTSKKRKKKSKKFKIQCILCYSRCIALHFQLLHLVS